MFSKIYSNDFTLGRILKMLVKVLIRPSTATEFDILFSMDKKYFSLTDTTTKYTHI